MSSRESIDAELLRTEESARYSAASQFSSGKFWRGLNLVLGIPAAISATLSGAAGLAEATTSDTAAILALIAAGLAATMTTLNAAQRANQSLTTANAYVALETDARVLRTVDLAGLSDEEARQRLDEIVDRRKTLNDTAPVPAFLAYRLGARNLKKGRQTYEVDNVAAAGQDRQLGSGS